MKVVYLQCNQGKDKYVILFSTDLELKGELLYQHYKNRYQIEFLFRDAGQYDGLTHCQARDEKKFHFHVAERIFANLELDLNQQKIHTLYHEILSYGAIRARAA